MKSAQYDILWNGEERGHSDDLAALFDNAQHVDIAVAFAKMSGWGHIKAELTALLERGGSARCMIGLDFCQSEPALLSKLLRLSQQFPLSVYVGSSSGYVFHPKVYRFEYDNGSVASLIGSANWTHGGLSDNFECSVLLKTKGEGALAKHFADLIANEDVVELTAPALQAYEKQFEIAKAARATEKRREKRLSRSPASSLALLREILREFRLDESEAGFDRQVKNRKDSAARAKAILRAIVTDKPTGARFEKALRELDQNFHSAIVPIFFKAIAREGKAFAALAGRVLESEQLSPEQAYELAVGSSIRGIGPNWISEMLHATNPAKFAVLNGNSSAGMRLAGQTFPDRPSNGNIKPKTYAAFCAAALDVASQLGLRNLSELDAVLNEAYWMDLDPEDEA